MRYSSDVNRSLYTTYLQLRLQEGLTEFSFNKPQAGQVTDHTFVTSPMFFSILLFLAALNKENLENNFINFFFLEILFEETLLRNCTGAELCR